jgi:hypothetical protein
MVEENNAPPHAQQLVTYRMGGESSSLLLLALLPQDKYLFK